VFVVCVYSCAWACMCDCMSLHVCICVFICKSLYVCVCMYAYMHAFMCMCVLNCNKHWLYTIARTSCCGRNSQHLQRLAIDYWLKLNNYTCCLHLLQSTGLYSCYYTCSSCGFSFNNWLCSYLLHIASSFSCNSLLTISCNCTAIAFSCISYWLQLKQQLVAASNAIVSGCSFNS